MLTFLQFVPWLVEDEPGTDSLFSYRSLNAHSESALYAWMRQERIPNPSSPNKLHVAIVNAKNNPSSYKVDHSDVVVSHRTFSLGILGPAYTLFFQSTIMKRQWEAAKNHGAKMMWPTFVPHISLTYHIPAGWHHEHIKPPDFNLTFVGEVRSTFDPQFAHKNWTNA